MFRKIFYTYLSPTLFIAVLSAVTSIILVSLIVNLKSFKMRERFEVDLLANIDRESQENGQTPVTDFARRLNAPVQQTVDILTSGFQAPSLLRFDTNPFTDPQYKITLEQAVYRDVDHLLQRMMDKLPVLQELYFLDLSGQVLAAQRRDQPLEARNFPDLGALPVLDALSTGTLKVSRIEPDPVTNSPMLWLCHPLKNINGKVNGACVAKLNLQYLIPETQALTQTTNGQLTLFYPSGKQLAEGISTNLGGEPYQHSPAFLKEGFAKGKGLQYVENQILSYERSPYGWLTVMSLPTEEILTPYQPMILQYEAIYGVKYGNVIFYGVIALLVIILLSVILGAVASRRVTLPLINITKATQKIADGDFSVRVAKTNVDELGNLTEAFNSMVAQLEATTEELVEKHQVLSEYSNRLMVLNNGLEEQVADRTEALTRKVEEIDQLVYRFSHDIKGPVDSIKGVLGVLDHLDLDKEMEKYIHLIQDRTLRLSGVLIDLMNVIEAEKIEEVTEPVHLEGLIQEKRDSLAEFPAWNEITFSYELAGPPRVLSQQRPIRSILHHLLINASQYHDPEKEHPSVRLNLQVNVRNKQHWLYMEVKDNGQGIPEDRQEKVFDMFYRGNKYSQGSGLGLYITRLTVEKLGGIMGLESQAGLGSTFWVEIPVEPVPEQALMQE